MTDEFFQTEVDADNPDEALLIIQDKMAEEASIYGINEHPNPPITMSDVENVRFTYCSTNRPTQG
jgi:hypothetical protein